MVSETTSDDLDQVALPNRRVLADTVLQIKELPKDKLLNNLKMIEQSLTKMVLRGLVFTIAELHRVTNDALTRSELYMN